MINLDNFDWGWMNEYVFADDGSGKYLVHIDRNGNEIPIGTFHKESIIQEIFVDKCYEKFFSVEEGDLVLWSSHLDHGYDINIGNGRVSISMNFVPSKFKSGPYTFSIQK